MYELFSANASDIDGAKLINHLYIYAFGPNIFGEISPEAMDFRDWLSGR